MMKVKCPSWYSCASAGVFKTSTRCRYQDEKVMMTNDHLWPLIIIARYCLSRLIAGGVNVISRWLTGLLSNSFRLIKHVGGGAAVEEVFRRFTSGKSNNIKGKNLCTGSIISKMYLNSAIRSKSTHHAESSLSVILYYFYNWIVGWGGAQFHYFTYWWAVQSITVNHMLWSDHTVCFQCY